VAHIGCPQCVRTVESGWKVCPHCGAALSQPTTPASRPAPVPNHRPLGAVVILVLVSIAAFGIANALNPKPDASPAPRRVPREPLPRLEFFIRPQLDGVRFRNDGTARWRLCRAEIDGHLAEFYEVQPGHGRTVTYREFKGLPEDEGFTRARRRLELTCLTQDGRAQSATYGVTK
jgi:hypothetical protein